MSAASYPTAGYNRPGAEGFRERLAEGTLLVQGPLGIALSELPGSEGIPATAWNRSEPQTVTRLHALFLASGAEVLVANTARASAPALSDDAVRGGVRSVNRAAVDCARQARGRYVLGAVGPCGLEWTLEDSPDYRSARAAYRDHAHALLDAGADGLLLEGFASIRDVEPALAGVFDVADGMPVLLSFALDDAGGLLHDGLNVEAAAMFAEKRGVEVVGVEYPAVAGAVEVLARAVSATSLPVMLRVSGEGDIAAEVPSWLAAGARLLGAATPRAVCALLS